MYSNTSIYELVFKMRIKTFFTRTPKGWPVNATI